MVFVTLCCKIHGQLKEGNYVSDSQQDFYTQRLIDAKKMEWVLRGTPVWCEDCLGRNVNHGWQRSLTRASFTNFAVPSCIARWVNSVQACPEPRNGQAWDAGVLEVLSGVPASSTCCTREIWGAPSLQWHIFLPPKAVWDMLALKPGPALAFWAPFTHPLGSEPGPPRTKWILVWGAVWRRMPRMCTSLSYSLWSCVLKRGN